MFWKFLAPCLLFFCAGLLVVSIAQAEQVQVAVAANFVPPFREIAIEFQKVSGHTVELSAGSSGKFYAQIKNGAPFEVFFSADDERPKLLEDEGLGVKGSRFTYAIGRLVLWSQDPALVTGEDTLRNGKFKHLAIANPKTAPYGTAAMQAMTKLGVWESLQPRIVMGENLGQTSGFLESGNAELGFLARSQVLDEKLRGKGSRWEVPQSLHEPIKQDAVLLVKGQDNPAAKSLMDFMHSSQARVIIERYGYELK
ncbi:MAG TPA: molybdate ABC transporter substrate-binding protein [Nitrospiraceae bacterium]|nr:molybdate ABC transporter substrate-binding protein [Nitrospiraceae bacterium]